MIYDAADRPAREGEHQPAGGVVQLSQAQVEGFFLRLADRDREEIASIDRKVVEAQAKAPGYAVSNGER